MAAAADAAGGGAVIQREEDEAYFLPLKRLGAPSSEYRGAILEEAWFMNPLPSATRFTERLVEDTKGSIPPTADFSPFGTTGLGSLFARPSQLGAVETSPESPMLSPAEANLRYKDVGLKFTAPVRESVARMMAESKVRERSWQEVYERARIDGGIGVGNKMLGVGLEFLASAADPLNIASAFIPVVSQVRWAQWAQRFGVGRARLATGAIEGAAGAAMVEPIVYLNALDEQLDYSAMNSLMNIGFGAGLGGGLHWAGGYARDRVMGRWEPQDIADMAAGRPRVADSQPFDLDIMDSPGFRGMDAAAAQEMARQMFNPTVAHAYAARSNYEAKGRFTADYPQSATSMYRGRFEGPEPWGYTIEQLRPETRESIIKTAVAQALDDRRIDVNPLAWTDPAYKPPKPHDLAMQSEVSPAVLRWAIETAELKGTKADPIRLRAQRIPASERPGRLLPAAMNRQQRRFAGAMDVAMKELGFGKVAGTDTIAPVSLSLTPPAGWVPSGGNARVAAILTGEEKAPQNLLSWIVSKGGIWDEKNALAGRGIQPGKKGVPPGLINNRRDAVELGVAGQKGTSLEDLARDAYEEGWFGNRRVDEYEASYAAVDSTEGDVLGRFLELVEAAVGGTPQYHPGSDYPRLRDEAAIAHDMLADYGFDVSKMPARDAAWLLDNPDVLGRFDEWRFVEGILAEPRSQEVQARLVKEIDYAQMDAMDEFAALWRAEASLESFRRGLGLEDEELKPVLKNLERDYAIVEQGLAEHEINRARFADDRSREANAVVESADESGAGAGRAADDGADGGAGQRVEGDRNEGQGAAVDPAQRSLMETKAEVARSAIVSPGAIERNTGKPAGVVESQLRTLEGEGLVSPPDAYGNRSVIRQTEPVIEKTDQGDQIVLPGAERISAEEMNARIIAKETVARMTASTRQDYSLGGLFDVQQRGQGDIFADTPITDVDRLVRKYGAEPEQLEARIAEMQAERSELAMMEGAGARVTKLQKQIADGQAALAEIRQREEFARAQGEEFTRRQGTPENDALIEPRNEVVEQYAKVESFTGENAVALEASGKQLQGHIDRLEAELGDKVDADQRAAIGDLDRQAGDFEKAGSAYLFCKAGDGE